VQNLIVERSGSTQEALFKVVFCTAKGDCEVPIAVASLDGEKYVVLDAGLRKVLLFRHSQKVCAMALTHPSTPFPILDKMFASHMLVLRWRSWLPQLSCCDL
jgi:hypothetical protein